MGDPGQPTHRVCLVLLPYPPVPLCSGIWFDGQGTFYGVISLCCVFWRGLGIHPVDGTEAEVPRPVSVVFRADKQESVNHSAHTDYSAEGHV